MSALVHDVEADECEPLGKHHDSSQGRSQAGGLKHQPIIRKRDCRKDDGGLRIQPPIAFAGDLVFVKVPIYPALNVIVKVAPGREGDSTHDSSLS